MTILDIERSDELLDYLRQQGHVSTQGVPRFSSLPGGVSNRTVLVERVDGQAFVIKQALEKLRVESDWRSDPNRSHREALGLQWLARLSPAGTITPILFEDTTHHLVAMQAVPQPHENWKSRLLAGQIESRHVEKFGELLGTIHRRARKFAGELASVFEDRTFFESLRLEPYYSFAAVHNPSVAPFFQDLISESRATRTTLVHGDYSPKNILIHRDALVLLDHEVIHWGDPAFDLGFSLTHLLSKAHHIGTRRTACLNAAKSYWKSYRKTAGDLANSGDLEARVVRHTLGCLLARVDGRSPLEYLSREERDRQRSAVLAMIENSPVTVFQLIEEFRQRLDSHQ